jgi:hypothetical protein
MDRSNVYEDVKEVIHRDNLRGRKSWVDIQHAERFETEFDR